MQYFKYAINKYAIFDYAIFDNDFVIKSKYHKNFVSCLFK